LEIVRLSLYAYYIYYIHVYLHMLSIMFCEMSFWPQTSDEFTRGRIEEAIHGKPIELGVQFGVQSDAYSRTVSHSSRWAHNAQRLTWPAPSRTLVFSASRADVYTRLRRLSVSLGRWALMIRPT